MIVKDYERRSLRGFFPRSASNFTRLAAIAASLFIGFTSPISAAPPALTAKMTAERGQILRGETKPLYVLLRFASPELDLPPTKRPPLNLSLVLDRSGSMSDAGKIDYLRQAAKMAVRSLGNKDTISVVEFDDRITILWEPSRAGDTSRLAEKIDDLTPRGSTNLAGGLQEGIEQAVNAKQAMRLDSSALNRVILLSDGLANVGVTDRGEIARMAGKARDKGVRVSSIGLGRDYDEDLMQAVAESGGGKYYYVEGASQLARIFQEELKTAFTTRARDVKLTFEGSGAVKNAELVGFGEQGRKVSVEWPDFYAGETRSILLRLDVAAGRNGMLDLGRVAIAWRDAGTGASGTLNLPLRVEVTDDRVMAERSLNKDVAVEASLAESERALERNVKLYESGKTDEARRANDAVIGDLRSRNASLKDARLARKIEAMSVEQTQMAAVAAAPPAEKQNYLKMTKQRLYQAKTGKRSGYLLQPGDKGLEVESLQRSLAKAGVYQGRITGVYDAGTERAVKAYQQKNAIDADGVAGAATQQKLGLY